MRTVGLLMIGALLAVGHNAEASVKLKKAKREAEKAAEAGLAKAKKACGNSGLKLKINWSALEKVDQKAIDETGRTRENIIGVFGSQVQAFGQGLAELCGDKDYQAEAKKLGKIDVIAPKDLKLRKNKYALKGKTLKVTVAPIYSNGKYDVQKALKEVF